MKTVRVIQTNETIDGERVARVPDERAAFFVQEGIAEYCPKHIWKEQIRDAKKGQKE